MLNKLIANLLPHMPRKLIWVFSKRYIAGERIEDALRVSKELNSRGIEVTIDLLGEFITNLQEAEENKNRYVTVIERFTSENIRGNFSVKPSMFGLLLDTSVCYRHLRDLVSLAAQKNNFIRIDMEDSQCVDAEIELFRKLHREFPRQVGLVMQAYLRRTANDLQSFASSGGDSSLFNFRLCKGIYVEPEQIAFKGYQEIRDHFLEDLEYILSQGMYAGIASHDKYLVDGALKLLSKYQTPKDRYEFQMLYGVSPELRQSLVKAGHRMRVYVPFGKEWFNYSTRRLKENPKIAGHIIRALFSRG
ncbi:MAG: proline dehydrogenase family protein [Mangrovibacterium sp.]